MIQIQVLVAWLVVFGTPDINITQVRIKLDGGSNCSFIPHSDGKFHQNHGILWVFTASFPLKMTGIRWFPIRFPIRHGTWAPLDP